MEMKLKRLIAREGLVLLGFCVLWLLGPRTVIYFSFSQPSLDVNLGALKSYLFLLYPIYLLLRFILWAVRTLRGKS